MHPAIVRRAFAAAAAMLLLTVPSVLAETVDADRDLLTAGFQNSYNLGTVQPGADAAIDVFFVLTCSGTSHVDTGQNIRLLLGSRTVPPGGGFSVGSLLFGKGAGWPADGQPCPAGIPPSIGGPLHIIVTAPTTPGSYRYMFSWTRSLTNPNASDGTVFQGGNPWIEIFLDVPGAANTPPTLHLPADSTIDGNTIGGATAAYVVTASDNEDAVPPTPNCSPAVGDLLHVGANTITCTATDMGRLSATGSFTITVRNTPPTLILPADSTIDGNTTGGATAAYVVTASDIEDAVAPSPSCSPAVGDVLPVGQNTISCSVTDGNGRTSTGSFTITVRNTAPTLHLPADSTVDGNTTGGATAAYVVTASDVEDAVAPTPSCSSTVGDVLPVGPNTISCTVTDTNGRTATGSFTITVWDTAPTLHLPADSTIDGNTTGGATAAYVATASDIEDAVAPTPSCNPAVGDVLPVGPNTINCSVTDTNGRTTYGSFTITVRDTAPTLHLPADSTIEGNTTGGATAAYVATATDTEDGSGPPPACSPAVGGHLNLGRNTISCTATDANGLPTSGSFVITVQDTTAPVIASIADIAVTTADTTGAMVDIGFPSVFEVVDPAPVVGCDHARDAKFPIGTTTVTCTARDSSGNTSNMAFHVRVGLLRVGGATWEDPVGAAAGIVVNGSRTIPVKVQLVLDGRLLTGGVGLLTVSACGGGPVATDDLAIQSNGRWMGHLSTDGLPAGCYRVTASIDGQAIGSFGLEVRNDSSAVSKPAKTPLAAGAVPATKPEKEPKPEKGPTRKS